MTYLKIKNKHTSQLIKKKFKNKHYNFKYLNNSYIKHQKSSNRINRKVRIKKEIKNTYENNYDIIQYNNNLLLRKYFEKYKQIIIKKKTIKGNKIFNNLDKYLKLNIFSYLNNKSNLRCINKDYNSIVKYNCHNCCKDVDLRDFYKCKINYNYIKLCRNCYKKWYFLLNFTSIECLRSNNKQLIKIDIDLSKMKKYQYFKLKNNNFKLYKYNIFNKKNIKLYTKKFFINNQHVGFNEEKIYKEIWYKNNKKKKIKLCEKIYNFSGSMNRITYFKNIF